MNGHINCYGGSDQKKKFDMAAGSIPNGEWLESNDGEDATVAKLRIKIRMLVDIGGCSKPEERDGLGWDMDVLLGRYSHSVSQSS